MNITRQDMDKVSLFLPPELLLEFRPESEHGKFWAGTIKGGVQHGVSVRFGQRRVSFWGVFVVN